MSTIQIFINCITIIGTMFAIYSVISKEISKSKFKREYINRKFWDRIYQKLNFEEIETNEICLDQSIPMLYLTFIQKYNELISFVIRYNNDELIVVKGKIKLKKIKTLFNSLIETNSIIQNELRDNWYLPGVAYLVKKSFDESQKLKVTRKMRKQFSLFNKYYYEIFILLNY